MYLVEREGRADCSTYYEEHVYEAINEHGYCDINLCADTIPEPRKDIQIPTFLTQYARGGVIENGNDKRKRDSMAGNTSQPSIGRGCGGLRVRS